MQRPDEHESHHSVPGCYAAELGDCRGRLSGEHWISAAILRLFEENERVSIRGAPWLEGKTGALPARCLTANVLCKGHNERLSGLDAHALVWARQMGLGTDEQQPRSVCPHPMIDGDLFERWLLKILCGLGVSGNLALQGTAIRGWKPPLEWVRILFGRATFSPGEGLYTRRVAKRAGGPYFAVTPLGPPGDLAALLLEVPGQALMLCCEPPRPPDVKGASFRPLVIGNALFHWRPRSRGSEWARWVRDKASRMPRAERPSRRVRRDALQAIRTALGEE